MARATHCLTCFAALENSHGVASTCSRCGSVNRPSMRRIYWNRHPALVRLERLGKTAVVALGLLGGGAILLFHEGASGSGAGYAMAMPVALGVALWGTLSKLTQHEHLFRPGIMWTVAFLVAGPVLFVGLWEALGPGVSLALGLACPPLALLSFLASRRLAAWKRALVTGEQAPPGGSRPLLVS